MKIKSIMALGAIAVLCGCQTSNQADYMQIGYGPSFDVAHAQCELQKGSADHGYIAIGSPGCVAGAGIGNALGNLAAEDQYMKNCLIINGWKRAPHGQGAAAAAAAVASGAPPTPYRIARAPGSWIDTALLDWSDANNKCVAGDKAACATRANPRREAQGGRHQPVTGLRAPPMRLQCDSGGRRSQPRQHPHSDCGPV